MRRIQTLLLLTVSFFSAIRPSGCLPTTNIRFSESHDQTISNVPTLIFGQKTMKSLLAFGDSYTFVQGVSGLTNYSFIGDALHFNYTSQLLLENKIVKNATSAGGPNWVEYLTSCFEGHPKDCQTQLWDFAFAGADISSEYLTPHHNTSVDLVDQIRQWDINARPVLNLKSCDTLVAFWIGINDINDSGKWTNTSFPDFYDRIIGTYFDSVELVYKRGFRNFLFMNLPPYDRTPSNLISSHPHPNTTQLLQFNNSLSQHYDTFQKKHKDAKSKFFDVNKLLNEVLDTPAAYRIENTTSFCPAYAQPDILWNYANYGCAPLETYFWYNSGHITYKVHQIIAQKLREYLK